MSYTYPPYLRAAAVPVDPTPTVIATVDVRDTRIAALYVKNLDAAQTVSVSVKRRAWAADDFSEGQVFDEFTGIPALTSRIVDFDCGVNVELQLSATASGAGCLVDVTVKPDGGRR